MHFLPEVIFLHTFPHLCRNILFTSRIEIYFIFYIHKSSYWSFLTSTYYNYNDFLDREWLLTRKILIKGFLMLMLKSSLRKFSSHHYVLVDRHRMSMSHIHEYVPFVVITIWSFSHSWLIIRCGTCGAGHEFDLGFSGVRAARS